MRKRRAGGGAPDIRGRQRRSPRGQHQVPEAPALDDGGVGDDHRLREGGTARSTSADARRPAAGRRRGWRAARPSARSTRATSAKNSAVVSSAGTRPPANASSTSTSALASASAAIPARPSTAPDPDPGAARERQPCADQLGQRGVRLEHDLGRSRTGGRDVARERARPAADVGDRERAGRQRVEHVGEGSACTRSPGRWGRRGRRRTAGFGRCSSSQPPGRSASASSSTAPCPYRLRVRRRGRRVGTSSTRRAQPSWLE